MFKVLLEYLKKYLPKQSAVKAAVKKHLKERIKKAEAKVREDIDFHNQQFNDEVNAAVTRLLEGKDAAVKRQVNALLSRIME